MKGRLQVSLGVILLVLLVTIIVSACGGMFPNQWGNWSVTNGDAYDFIQRIDPRGNGVMGIWLRNDEFGFYCWDPKDRALKLPSHSLLQEWAANSVFVNIKFSDYSAASTHPCKSSETSSESGYHVYALERVECLSHEALCSESGFMSELLR